MSVHKLAIIYNRRTKQSKMRGRGFQHLQERDFIPCNFFSWQCSDVTPYAIEASVAYMMPIEK